MQTTTRRKTAVRRFAVHWWDGGRAVTKGRVGGAPAGSPQPVEFGGEAIGAVVCTRGFGARWYEATGTGPAAGLDAGGTTASSAAYALCERLIRSRKAAALEAAA